MVNWVLTPVLLTANTVCQVSMELMSTSNSFPYAVALQFKGNGTDNLNTLGRRSGNR